MISEIPCPASVAHIQKQKGGLHPRAECVYFPVEGIQDLHKVSGCSSPAALQHSQA
jgi:hypothetical protein